MFPISHFDDAGHFVFERFTLYFNCFQSSGFKGSIVEAALDILIALANNLPDTDIARYWLLNTPAQACPIDTLFFMEYKSKIWLIFILQKQPCAVS